MKKYLPLFVFILVVLFFFRGFFISSKLPIPSDTIVGLYNPFRDLYAKQYPNGIPYKNFLITDPVRQQFPWRQLAISIEKKLELPLWNPYSFSGSPLLANFQSAAFYPLDILFFILPFPFVWSMLIFLQPLLMGIFLYLYLDNLKLNKRASFLGSTAFAFSGFSVAWMEWGTVVQTALWLPLILLAKDNLLKKISFGWVIVLIFAEISQIFAGHLQTWFYSFLISNAYLLFRIIQPSFIEKGKKSVVVSSIKKYIPFLIMGFLIFTITAIQWIPTFQFISQSARSIDLNWHKAGWFIPWKNLIQFIVPDFFGNPATLNYWGVWNYAEFIGYVGIAPLTFALFALFFRRDKNVIFFGSLLILSFLFSLPTVFAKIPFQFNIPFLSTAQPTRLLFITDFSLSILAAFGFDLFLKNKKGIISVLALLSIMFIGLWLFILNAARFGLSYENILITKHNLIFSFSIFLIVVVLISILCFFSEKKKLTMILYVSLMIVAVFDLLRFGEKFTPFTNQQYLFPQTNTISFLQKNIGNFRIMITDSQILPPNFSIFYKLQSVEGYDPLYMQRYAEFIAASERKKPDIKPPFGFNRIITPHNVDSKLIDLLGVKYVLSLSDLSSPKLKKVFQEGQTRVYENTNVLPRAFFVQDINKASNKQQAIDNMFKKSFSSKISATVELYDKDASDFSVGKANIIMYTENRVIIKTQNSGVGFLVLTDMEYPTWYVKIDGVETAIYTTDYLFRGVIVPSGNHIITFEDRVW